MILGSAKVPETNEHPDGGPAGNEARAGDSGDQHRQSRSPDRRRQRSWVPTTAGWLSLIIGVYNILGVITPEFYERLHRIGKVMPGGLSTAARTADVITGLLLIMLAHALRRRKRRAWQAVTILLAVNIVAHVVHGPQLGQALVAAVVLCALLYFRDEFYAVGDPRTRWRALWVFAGLAIADVVIGLAYIRLGRIADDYSLTQQIRDVIYELVGITSPIRFASEGRTDTYHLMTSALGLFTLIVAAYMFLRPAEPAGRLSAHDEEQIRDLLTTYGERDSLGYFALRRDKSVIWSPTGKSCIGYRVVSGVMLAAADPIGDPEAWPGAMHAFLDEAARHAWVPAVMGCSELGAEVWCREGDLTALELGDEAIVEVADFSLAGRAMRNVRQMVSRVARHGYCSQVRRIGDIPREEIDRMCRQSDSWRGSQTERGFSMALGRIGEPGDDQCVVATATEDGVLRAVLHFVPWGADGLSLDLMRRDRQSQPGLNDFLITETIKAAPGLSVQRISLNFAVFRSALERGERIGAGPVLRAWRAILIFLSKWFQIESLYKFNAKFRPIWKPRFFVFPSTRDTPRIAIAALEAEAFLVWPQLKPRVLARKLGLGKVRRMLKAPAPRA
ncbi:MAG TPA: phosphatidylglycerol lysyltransferase domain-containing protein [Streptosporangiaceae bacterium]|nr:phosphatidylglycerol lysyltransferase domain-containing protein [Streptosporangiaceae bacterium]